MTHQARSAAALLLAGRPRLGVVRLGVVDGPSGSGKSTFALEWAALVADRLGGPVLAVGQPFLPADRRDGRPPCVVLLSTDLLATWTDPFGWWDRLADGVLRPLAAGQPGRLQLTDWSAGDPRPGRWVDVVVPTALILEGVSVARRELGDRATTSVWVEVADPSVRLERAVARDGETSRSFLTAWQSDEDRHFAQDRTRRRADLFVVPDRPAAP